MLTPVERWHDNYHHRPVAGSQGLRWSRLDLTYWTLALHRLVPMSSIREPRESPAADRRVSADTIDIGRYRQRLARAAGAVPASDPAPLAAIETLGRRQTSVVETTPERASVDRSPAR